MFDITGIPALRDNYVWAIHDGRDAVVIDPGEAAPVLSFLETAKLRLSAILCTHRHADHTGGIAALREVYNAPVYGRLHSGNPHITHDLREGARLELAPPGVLFDILEIPGHLDDHLAYVTPGVLFCGDTLFGAGCGRNFEGAPAQLFHSLQRLAALPDDTLVYCAHEYTEINLPFALACEPDNQDIRQRIEEVARLRAADQPTLPSSIALEKATNPFLRCTQPDLIRTLQARGLLKNSGAEPTELDVFIALRAWRNNFESVF